MRTFRLAAIAVAFATYANPLWAAPARTTLGIPGPGSPSIDLFSLDYLNHSYMGAHETAVQTGRAGGADLSYTRRTPRRPVPTVGGTPEIITTTPEPEAFLLMGTGLLVLLAFARTRGNA